MDQIRIETLINEGSLRIRQVDCEKIKSLIKSAETNARIAKSILLSEDSATVIFREIYESVRQLGDAKWWLLGYEPCNNHQISLEILKEMDVQEKILLNHIDRFRKIRNDANYRGFKISESQAKEIAKFWDKYAKEITLILMKEIR